MPQLCIRHCLLSICSEIPCYYERQILSMVEVFSTTIITSLVIYSINVSLLSKFSVISRFLAVY